MVPARPARLSRHGFACAIFLPLAVGPRPAEVGRSRDSPILDFRRFRMVRAGEPPPSADGQQKDKLGHDLT